MQVHAYVDNRAHRADLVGKIDVFLDGRNITSNCIFADDVAGVVEVYVLDKLGHKIVDYAKVEMVRKTLHGRVEIARRIGAALPIDWREPRS